MVSVRIARVTRKLVCCLSCAACIRACVCISYCTVDSWLLNTQVATSSPAVASTGSIVKCLVHVHVYIVLQCMESKQHLSNVKVNIY